MNFYFRLTQERDYINRFLFRNYVVLHLVVLCFLLIQFTLVLKQCIFRLMVKSPRQFSLYILLCTFCGHYDNALSLPAL